jgi:peptidoglycan hydrolase CwlO-like protein
MDWQIIILAALSSAVISTLINAFFMRPKVLAEADEIRAKTRILRQQELDEKLRERSEKLDIQLTEEEITSGQLRRLFEVTQHNMESTNALIVALQAQLTQRDAVVDDLIGQIAYREAEAEKLLTEISDLKQQIDFEKRFCREQIERLEQRVRELEMELKNAKH